MPVLHDQHKLNDLLIEHGIPLNDSIKRGNFYKEYYDWKEIKCEYESGNSIRELCRKYNISYDVMRANLIRNGSTMNPFSVKGRSKYSLKPGFFIEDTCERAYILGWLYSDGHVDRRKISITLQDSDSEHLTYLASLMCNKEILTRKVGFSFDFYSVTLCDFLIKDFKFSHDKSHQNFRIPLSKFSRNSFPYLLLGLLEGDGSVSKSCPSVQLLLTKSTWIDIKSVLEYERIPFTNVRVNVLNDYGLLSICFSGLSYFYLLEFIYSSTTGVYPLKRKLKSFKDQLIRSANGKTSPYKLLAFNVWDSLIHTGVIPDTERCK